jgi:hypothetical protein
VQLEIQIRVIVSKITTNARGAILPLALILFALGALMIAPLLSFMAGGFKSTDQVYDQAANELYGADAGVRDAIWNMKNNPLEIPQTADDPLFSPSTPINLNNKSIDYSVSFISSFSKIEDEGETWYKTYKIESTATGADGNITTIDSYAIQPFGYNNSIFSNAITSGEEIDFKKDCLVVNGEIAYKSGPKPNEGYVFYDPDGDGDDDSLPPADPDLELPSHDDNQKFANSHKNIAAKGGDSGPITLTGGNLGPLLIEGNLGIEGCITLTGTVYVTGSITFDKGGILNGRGTAIAEGDINCKKENTMTADPDTRIVYMSLNGDIDLRKGQNAYNALFYAPEGKIWFKKDQTIYGSLVAGQGFSTDKNLNITMPDSNETTILPGYIALNPQLQTWDIGGNPGIGISPATLPSCNLNTAYPGQTVTASGGAEPYSWSISSGALPGGLTLNSSTGVISGTPTAADTFNFTVTATDSTGATGIKSYSITITVLTIITGSSLPSGEVGVAYNTPVMAAGGTPGYSWSVISGALPPGLSLGSGGVISGTPTSNTGSPYSFTVQVADSASPAITATRSFSITISGLSITTTDLDSGWQGIAFSQSLAASGGISPLTWSITSGTLPDGLTLNGSTGMISGTPATSTGSPFSFTVQVADSASPANTATRSLSIAIAALVITPADLPEGDVDTLYPGQTFTTADGAAPYTWQVIAGSLPGGLSLSSTGVLSGTPVAIGTFSFAVRVTDSLSATGMQAMSLRINQLPVIQTASLPGGDVGVAYSQTLVATGGSGAPNWSLSSGTLPEGLTLNTSSGVISGTPTTAGTFNFSVRLTDDLGVYDTRALSITISPPLTITTDSLPDGVVGISYAQSLSSAGGAAPYNWSVTSGSLPPGLSLSAAGVISGTPSSDMESPFIFTVQVTDSTVPAHSTDAQALSITISAPASEDKAPSLSVSGGQFTNPDNVFSLNSVYATTADSNNTQKYGGFDFSIPAGRTITGVKVIMTGYCSGKSATLTASLSWDGGATFTSTQVSGNFNSSSNVTWSLGGSADTWGRSWSYADFSNLVLRLVASGVMNGGHPLNIDYVQVTVYYSP